MFAWFLSFLSSTSVFYGCLTPKQGHVLIGDHLRLYLNMQLASLLQNKVVDSMEILAGAKCWYEDIVNRIFRLPIFHIKLGATFVLKVTFFQHYFMDKIRLLWEFIWIFVSCAFICFLEDEHILGKGAIVVYIFNLLPFNLSQHVSIAFTV